MLYRHPIRSITGSTVHAGGELSVFDGGEGSETLSAVYADPDLVTRLANPLTADAAGYFQALYTEVLKPVWSGESQPRDVDGALMPGATLTFYAENTHELAEVFEDAGLSSESDNPLTADEDGEFDAVYLDDDIHYRAVLKDQHGRLIYDVAVRPNGDDTLYLSGDWGLSVVVPEQPPSYTVMLLHFDEDYLYNETDQPLVDSATDPNTIVMEGGDGFGPISQDSVAVFDSAIQINGYSAFHVVDPTFDIDDATQWSIEAFIRIPVSGSGQRQVLLSQHKNFTPDTFFGLNEDDEIAFTVGGTDELVGSVMAPNTWVHVYLSRNGNNFYLFEDGVLVDSASGIDPVWDEGNGISMLYATFTEGAYAFVDEMRITVGGPVHTSNFTPPDEPYDP